MLIEKRAVCDEDNDFLYTLYESTRLEEMKSWGLAEEQQKALMVMQFQAQRQSYAVQFPDAEHQVILTDGERCGRVVVHRTDQEIRLVDIAILPAYQNRGIGTSLIREILEEAKTNHKEVSLTVMLNNPAYRLYARLGFSETARDFYGIQMKWSG